MTPGSESEWRFKMGTNASTARTSQEFELEEESRW